MHIQNIMQRKQFFIIKLVFSQMQLKNKPREATLCFETISQIQVQNITQGKQLFILKLLY